MIHFINFIVIKCSQCSYSYLIPALWSGLHKKGATYPCPKCTQLEIKNDARK